MQNSSGDMIHMAASYYNIDNLDSEAIPTECRLCACAYIFARAGELLNGNLALSPPDIQRIGRAFNELSIKLNNWLREPMDEKWDAGIRRIQTPLVGALAHLVSASTTKTQLDLFFKTDIRKYQEILPFYNSYLLYCRNFVAEINNEVALWAQEQEMQFCWRHQPAG